MVKLSLLSIVRKFPFPSHFIPAAIAAFILCGCEGSGAKTIHILPGGGVGDGSRGRPFRVASAAEFDALMSGLPEGARIRLGEGVFQTKGVTGFRLKSGQRFVGAGMGKTVLRLAGPPTNSRLAVVVGTEKYTCRNITVEDLTIDCNYQPGWGAVTVQGIGLGGTGHAIRRVEVVGAAGWAQECFALGVFANGPSRGNLVEHCVVRNYHGGWCTAIFLVNNSCLDDPKTKNPAFTSGEVRFNHVDLGGGRFAKGGGCAYGGGGLDRAVFRDNLALNANYGFNFDTTRLMRTVIKKNRFLNCSFTGINTRANRPGDRIEDLTISGNHIELTPPGGQPSAFGIAGGGNDQAPAANLRILDNTIVSRPASETTQVVGLQLFGWAGPVDILGNRFENTGHFNILPGPRYRIAGNSPQNPTVESP